MKILLISILSFLLSLSMATDDSGNFAGVITNNITNAPIENVVITVKGDYALEHVYTNYFGEYWVIGLKPGRYTIIVTSEYYYSFISYNNYVTDGKTTVVNFKLIPKIYDKHIYKK